MVSPKILKKINKQRNLLEHEYKYPSKDDVEDALDVVELFLIATEKFIRKYDFFDIEVGGRIKKFEDVYIGVHDSIKIKFNTHGLLFSIEYTQQYLVGKEIKHNITTFQLSSEHTHFLPLLKKYVEFINQA